MKTVKFPHLFPINIDELDAVKTDEGHIWGYEKWLVNDEELDIGCKFLIIFPGFLSSKHNHETKCEYFQVLSGELRLHIWNEGKDNAPVVIHLGAGKQHYIEKGVYHRFETGTRQFTLLLEVSTFEDEQTDKLDKARQLYEVKE